jgi:signal transduction histidine kinase
VPSEVEPLVEEVNALPDAQEREIVRSRGRAADLAHGFKTPLAVLIADAARLRERGDSKMAQDIEAVADPMSRYVDRELALARLRSGARNTEAAVTEIYPLLSSLLTTLARTPYGERVRFERSIPEGLRIPLDRTDLAEVLGNLLENAARHAKARVSITANAEPLSVVVEDDGEGIPEEQIARVLERGGRLDEQGSGTGLGLAIVQDVLEAYGWRVQITRSELGGARVTIAPGTDIRARHCGRGSPSRSHRMRRCASASLLPAQPWQTGIHIEVAEKLEVSRTKVQRAIDQLMKSGRRIKQMDGNPM